MISNELLCLCSFVTFGKIIHLHFLYKNIRILYKDPHIWLHWNNKTPWKNQDWWWNQKPWTNPSPWKNNKPWYPNK